MTSKSSREMWIGVALVLLAIVGWLFIIPKGIVVPDGVEVRALSPDFWPLIVVAVAGLASAVLMVQGMVMWKKTAHRGISQESDEHGGEMESDIVLPFSREILQVVITLCVLFAMYYAILQIGMVAATIPALGFLTWFGGEKRWKIILPVAVVLPLTLYFFFVYVANVPIPLGVFEALR